MDCRTTATTKTKKSWYIELVDELARIAPTQNEEYTEGEDHMMKWKKR